MTEHAGGREAAVQNQVPSDPVLRARLLAVIVSGCDGKR